MSLRVVGGYLLTYKEASDAAHKLGLYWNPDPEVHFGCRQKINHWIWSNAPQYWSNRLQPIILEESGESVTKLIFPIVGNTKRVEPGLVYSETEGTPAKFREDARAMGLPDEFFVNFVTIHKPEIEFSTPPGFPGRIRLRAR
ncbi:unnamed protein product [Rhizoctonia solani]|uniref:Uncharacterized protein n=1 Tax=Rhizoctonia solani TaxID=456999 RepID=A0A8H3HJK5_9AGAM|nr:unnamed protein product [Rhizoctonia solani]